MLLRAHLGLTGSIASGAQRTCVIVFSTYNRGGGRGSRRSGRGPRSPFEQKQQDIRKDAEEVSVPEVGWMWQKPSSQQQQQTSSPPSAMRTVANLRADRIGAKKSLGQNFLTDDGILKDIVLAARVKAGDVVLEVGPGTGNLTKHLITCGAQVTAIEKDDTLYARLVEEYKQEPRLHLVHSDVLRANLERLIAEMLAQPRDAASGDPLSTSTSTSTSTAASEPAPASGAGARGKGPGSKMRKVKVVANLPYNITKEFLIKMLPMGDLVSELSIMIQEEAAVRLAHAKPGDTDYRAMNLRVAMYSKPKYKFKISKTKYFPEPGVDGALVTFELIPPAARKEVGGERKLLSLVDKAYNGRRKMLRNSLGPLYTPQQVDVALAAAGLPASARAQDLGLEQWAALHLALQSAVLTDLGVEGFGKDRAAAAAGAGDAPAQHEAQAGTGAQ